jgi:heme A synthase
MLDAGFAYNSWPLMDGTLLPPEELRAFIAQQIGAVSPGR